MMELEWSKKLIYLKDLQVQSQFLKIHLMNSKINLFL